MKVLLTIQECLASLIVGESDGTEVGEDLDHVVEQAVRVLGQVDPVCRVPNPYSCNPRDVKIKKIWPSLGEGEY